MFPLKPTQKTNELTKTGEFGQLQVAAARFRRLLFALCILLVFSLSNNSTVQASVSLQSPSLRFVQSSDPAGAAKPEEHGLSPKPFDIVKICGIPITNSMVVTWFVAVGLIIFARIVTQDMKPVPTKAQNFLEWLVGGLRGFIEKIVGPHLVDRTFWFFATLFIFIAATNLVSLIPGVGTIGWGHQVPRGFQVDQPIFRGGNADVNMTLAMALVFFACWIVWGLQVDGLGGFLKELFGPKGETTGLLKPVMIVMFFAAGCLEIISILFRPVSLSFRLYGNIYAGENMLESMRAMIYGLGWLLPIPFYLLEVLMGLVQALVFMLLTAVFTMLICQHEGEGKEVVQH